MNETTTTEPKALDLCEHGQAFYCSECESATGFNPIDTRKNRRRVQLIQELSNASYECGEWNSNESDEDYEDVHARSLDAEALLLIELSIPDAFWPEHVRNHFNGGAA